MLSRVVGSREWYRDRIHLYEQLWFLRQQKKTVGKC